MLVSYIMAENQDTILGLRSTLPSKMLPRTEVGVWSLLKNFIGKDLSKITMPVVLNEPLSFLQRLCEYMEYSHLLTMAAKQEHAEERMKYISAFAVSSLASNWERLGKPFNPILGETFELQRHDFRIICEQVSHHPPISAFHAESPDFKFHGSINPKLKFWGKSVEIQPEGTVTVELLKWGEVYTWTNVNCCVHNIIVGKLWIEQYGIMEILNHVTLHKSVLKFKEANLNPRNMNRVDGYVEDKNGQKLFYLYGKWTEYLKSSSVESFNEYFQHKSIEKKANVSPESTPRKVFSKFSSLKMNSLRSLSIQDEEIGGSADISDITLEIPGSHELWRSHKRPEHSRDYYHFSTFAFSLNQMEENMKSPDSLCPTDSRLRPDIRFLEEGDINSASIEKARLEEKQRKTQNKRKFSNEQNWTPRWFQSSNNKYTQKLDWFYKGGYWNRNYSNIETIY